MGATSECEKNTQNETLAIDQETAALLRQFQAKTGLEVNTLIKQAVDRMYRDIKT